MNVCQFDLLLIRKQIYIKQILITQLQIVTKIVDTPISNKMFGIYFKGDDSKKCLFCQSEVDQKVRPVFRHLKPNNREQCSRFICIWCCNQQLYIKKDLKFNSNGDMHLDCCNTYLKITQKVKDFLNKNCAICKTNCKSQRFDLDQNKKLHVGRQCYLEIADKLRITISREQNQLKSKIQKFIKSKCMNCEGEFNSIKAKNEQLEFKFCNECYKKSFKQQKADLKSIKKCSNCSQKDVFQKLETKWYKITSQVAAKRLKIIQFKIDHIDKKFSLFCPYCLYEIYLELQSKQKKNLILPKEWSKLKERFQNFFWQSCMICGFQPEKNDKVYIIKSPYVGLVSFMCKTCQGQLLTNKCRFQCVDRVKQFLQKTNQLESLREQKYKYQLKTIVECNLIKKNFSSVTEQNQNSRDQFFYPDLNEVPHQSMRQKKIKINRPIMKAESNGNKNEQIQTRIGEFQSQSLTEKNETEKNGVQIFDQNHSVLNKEKEDNSLDNFSEECNDLQSKNYQHTQGQFIDFIDGFNNGSQIKVSQVCEIKLQQQLVDYSKTDEFQPLKGEVQSLESIYNEIISVSLSTLFSEQIVNNKGEPIDCKCLNTCRNKQPVLNLGLFCDPCFYMYLFNLIDEQNIESQKVNQQTKIHSSMPKIYE